jgi:DNA repair protein RadA/Sms
MTARLNEAAKLGFKTAVVPRRVRRSEPWPPGIEVLEARSIREAIKLALINEEK